MTKWGRGGVVTRPPGGGAKGGYLPQPRLLVWLPVRAEPRRSRPCSSCYPHPRPRRRRRRRRRLPPPPSPPPPLLPASLPFSLPLPQLPPRSRPGLPAFVLAIGQSPRRSVLRPSQPRTGLALSTAARNKPRIVFPASLGKEPSLSEDASHHWLCRGPPAPICAPQKRLAAGTVV